jgi:hypothetical protein
MENVAISDKEEFNFNEELAAVARLISFARQAAAPLDIDGLTYCLDLALVAVVERALEAELDLQGVAANDHQTPFH